jgi:hypothetical protein
MQRDVLLLTEMIDAAEQAHQLTAGITVSQLEADRQRRDALLWNFTVLGEAAGQLSAAGQAGVPGGGADLAQLIPDVPRGPGGLDGIGVAQVPQPAVRHAAHVRAVSRAEGGQA